MEQNNQSTLQRIFQQHTTAIYFSVAGILLVIVILILLRLSGAGTKNFNQTINPSPTPFEFGKETNGNIALTPLQKTEIGKTTDEEIEAKNKVISKADRNGVIIYKIESKIPLTPDEIRTRNGVVIFERTSTKTDTAAPLQNLSDYEVLFGKPELVIDRVGPLGWENSAYLYPTKGFILFANRYTKSVYEVQRFQPMSLQEYRNQYGAEFLSPAPSAPPEGFQ